MAVNDYTLARTPKPTDLSVQNNGGSDLAAGLCVSLDVAGANLIPAKDVDGVILSTTDDAIYGVLVETCKASGGTGRVAAGDGDIVVCIADSAITAGTWVEASTNGKIKTQGAGKPSVGLALNAAGADGDHVRVKLHIAHNA